MSITANAAVKWSTIIARLESRLTHPHLLIADRDKILSELKDAKSAFSKIMKRKRLKAEKKNKKK